MRVSAKALILFALFVVFYTGFQGGRYYISNRVQELGILMSMSLFFYSSIVAGLYVKDKDLRWNWWFFATLFFIGYTFILPAYVFSQNIGVAMLPSVFASREFLIIFFGPAIYFLYRLGFDIKLIEKVFVIALVFLAFNYLFFYFKMDLVSAYFSTNAAIAGLVTYDPWRGYRLKPSSIALFLLSILSIFMLIKSKGLKKLGWLVVVCVVGYIWALVQARSMAASLILAALCYPLFFGKKGRLAMMFMAIPPLIMIIGFAVITIGEKMETAAPDGDGVRLVSYRIAVNSIKERPFLGLGQQSGYTVTEQEIFWYKFYSSDLGLVGTTFKYGLIGGAAYIFFSIFLIQRVVRTIWLYKRAYGYINPVLFSVYAVLFAGFINIALNPALVYIPGLTLGAFAIGYTSALRHSINKEFKEKALQKKRHLQKVKTLPNTS